MGPRFNGVEDTSGHVERPGFAGPSMGPRFNGVEDQPTLLLSHANARAFNGATL